MLSEILFIKFALPMYNRVSTMKFIVRKKKPVSDENLLIDLKETIKLVNSHTITMKVYDEKGNYNSSTIIRRFGSWNSALSLIDKPLNNKFHSEKELFDNIRDVWLIKGIQPTRRDMDNHSMSKISSGSYMRHFGSWYNALDAFVQYMSDSESDILPINSNDTKDVIKHKTNREPSDRLKVQVLMRDGNRCRLCGVECNDGLHNIHFDHILPWSKGGETILDNLQVLCRNCNLAKGNID